MSPLHSGQAPSLPFDLSAVKGLLFDKDGTLVDFEATWGPATAEVLRELSDDAETVEYLASSCAFEIETQRFKPGSPIIGGHTHDFAPAWAHRLGASYDAVFVDRVNALFRTASLRYVRAYDDVRPVLAQLSEAGFVLGIATNDSEATAVSHLERLSIRPLFDFVAGYDSGYGPKPGPGMVEAFAQRLGVSAPSLALIGDSPHDMLAAQAAGAVPVGMVRTPQAEAALQHLAVTSVPDLAALRALLGLDQLR